MPDSSGRTRIVILGGGFGGVYTALHLQRLARRTDHIHITLVSRDNYFLMTPLLFEAGSGVLEPRHAVTPIRPLIQGATTRFIEADVEGIDLDRRHVLARHSPAGPHYQIPYDHLVFALGGVTNRQLIPGAENAMSFKFLADAIFLRNHIIDLFEQADVEQDPARKQELLTFIVIGAGLVGVELLGEMTSFIEQLVSSYPHVRPQEIRFFLIEAGPGILPEMEPDLARYAAHALAQRGVRILTNMPASRIEPWRVLLPDGQWLSAATIILATGVAPNPLLAGVSLPRDAKGRIAASPTMQVPGHPGIWALGDCAAIPDPQGKPYPSLAQHALREARTLAGNILATLRGGVPKPFLYRTLGALAALGHYRGVGRIGRARLRGFVAWWVWRTYYLFQMPRLDRRLRIMLDWTIALLFRADIVKLDLFGEEHPLRRRPNTGPRTAQQRQVQRGEPVMLDGPSPARTDRPLVRDPTPRQTR